MMRGFGYGGFGLLGGLLGLLFFLLVIAAVVVLVVLLVRRSGSTAMRSRPGEPSSPREILDTRYARGEITREQYQQILQDISQPRA
jgi:putative membrane protein